MQAKKSNETGQGLASRVKMKDSTKQPTPNCNWKSNNGAIALDEHSKTRQTSGLNGNNVGS